MPVKKTTTKKAPASKPKKAPAVKKAPARKTTAKKAPARTIYRKMKLQIWTNRSNGAAIEQDIMYEGGTEAEVLALIVHDQEEISYYMKTGDTKKIQCFCFQGIYIKKAGIVAIKLSEADY